MEFVHQMDQLNFVCGGNGDIISAYVINDLHDIWEHCVPRYIRQVHIIGVGINIA